MPFTTEAAVLTADSGSRCELQPLIVPDPAALEMVVELRACGICHTDLGFAAHVARPAVLGHEGAGVVKAVGDSVSHNFDGVRPDGQPGLNDPAGAVTERSHSAAYPARL